MEVRTISCALKKKKEVEEEEEEKDLYRPQN